jgi:hypothetical protein
LRFQTLLLLTALSLGAVNAPSVALAQSPDAHARAEQQFRQARKAMDAKEFRQALSLLHASQDLEARPSTLLNIAVCEEELGMLATAMRHFEDVMIQLKEGDARLPVAKEHIVKLGPRLPHVRIEMPPGAPEGTVILLDGAPVAAAALGSEIPVDPGKHEVIFDAPGSPERRYEVVAEEAKRVVVAVEPWPDTGAPPPPPLAEMPQPRNNRRLAGYVVGGVGLAGLGAGAVIGILTVLQHDELERKCPSHTGCPPEVIRGASEGQSLSLVSTVALAAGAVGLGVGTYLVLSSGPAKKTAATATVGATVLPGGAMLGAWGTF